ncbi:MAG: putative 4-hydroxybenzoate polyprenyltransferase [Bacteroidia bacterium]|nr:putative 4-hydroxybenzoate polyprenyltransferase [Bacteroidia bacterium]MDW8236187.1 4-hydroxybenzoate octaprenyltransferase [Bacteroidia bacterium]
MGLGRYARLVAWTHSVFALPFALWGFVLGLQAAQWSIPLHTLVLVIAAAISARTAAMAFNRYADRAIDARNPRTASREIPRGEIKPHQALLLVVGASATFILIAAAISPLCGWLSPIALFVLLGYSYTKRFTYLSHYVLGMALGLAPIGAYLAATGTFSLTIILVGIAVMLWVAGFDILYALQDEEFDRKEGLYSIPAAFGEEKARLLALSSHLLAIILLAVVGYLLNYSSISLALYSVGWLSFSGFILYQHRVSQDKAKINRAFFTYNGIASLVYGGLVVMASLWEPLSGLLR